MATQYKKLLKAQLDGKECWINVNNIISIHRQEGAQNAPQPILVITLSNGKAAHVLPTEDILTKIDALLSA